MIPLRVLLRGFMSYREEQELIFDQPLCVLAGRNGAGKSSIFDAIAFALYGRGTREDKLVHLINHEVEAMEVELDLQVDDVVYRVHRTATLRQSRTGKRREERELSTLREVFRLVPREGVPPGGWPAERIDDTAQEKGFELWRRRVLGIDYDAFTASVMLVQGDSEKLLRARPAERHDILAALLDLSRYEALHGRADRLRIAEERRVKLLSAELGQKEAVPPEALQAAAEELQQAQAAQRATEEELGRLQRLLGLCEQWERLSRWHKELCDRQRQLPELDRQLRAEEQALRRVEREVEQAAQEEERLRGEGERASEELLRLTGLAARAGELTQRRTEQAEARERRQQAAAELDRLIPEEGRLGAELERRQEGRAAAQREVDGRRAQLATAEAERREAERHLTLFGSAAKAPLCEMCGQEISRRYAAERSQHLTRALAAAQERLLAAQAALSEGEGRLAQAQQAEAEVQARLMQVRRERSAWEEKLRQAADRLDAATARIAELCAGASEAELLQAAAQEAEQRRRRDDLRRRWKEAHAAGKAAAQRRDAARQRIEQLRKERDQGDHLAGQIAEIARQLAALPEEARRPAAEVEALIQGLSRRQKELSVEQGRRAQALADLRRKVEERQRREAEQDQAARDLALYKRVAELLGPGPGGLQRHLVREAEEGIVRYANDILHDLTQGRLRLRLQREDSPGAQKALDLLVYNQETSDRPMPIAMCSGSQRFRIAISLALATGRYLSQNARRVESVIIDEGFGCLDQEGRADTVEVLRALKAHLKRIILVSHQEELTQSFTHGYRIELRERASVPVPL